MPNIEIKKHSDKIVVNIKKERNLWFIHYLDGYFKSTFLLLEKLNLENKTLIYPVLFNFSQYLELWIKLLLLVANDTDSVNQLKIGNHSIEKTIKDVAGKCKDLLESYNISTSLLYDIADKYSYFLDYTFKEKNMSIVARYPLNSAGTDVIINFDKIDEAEKDCYMELKEHISDLLVTTNKITKVFFVEYFNKNFYKNKEFRNVFQQSND